MPIQKVRVFENPIRKNDLVQFDYLFSDYFNIYLTIMHFGILTYGSRGDVQPYIALALGLMERGNRVTLVANENFKTFVENYGVNFYPIHVDIERMVHSSELTAVLKSGNMISYLHELHKLTKKTQPIVNADMLKGCAFADVLIATPLTLIWVYSIAEKLKKRWAIVQLSIPSIPTKEFPFASLSFLNAPYYNLLTYKIVRNIYWGMNKKEINQHRSSLQLLPLNQSILKKIDDQKILTLHAISPGLIRRPQDWEKHVDITGFLFIPEINPVTIENQFMPRLEEWLNKGEAPVYIGFGSIPIPDPDLFSRILKEIIKSSSHRIIFCQGWSELTDLPKDERLFIIRSVSHEWLFPQCKAAIIHGGVGTLAAVLKAGIPPIIVSIFADQPLWGKIIVEKGLGAHIPFKKLNSVKLLEAIATINETKVLQNVAILGERIKKENGLETTINFLLKYFS
jgi:sterol 3beta-glucosyltransferase